MPRHGSSAATKREPGYLFRQETTAQTTQTQSKGGLAIAKKAQIEEKTIKKDQE